MAKKHRECCPLFTEALHSGGSFEQGLLFSREPGGKSGGVCYCFRIPGKGRGGKRTLTRNLVMEHCPFCGAPPKAGPKPEGSSEARKLGSSEVRKARGLGEGAEG